MRVGLFPLSLLALVLTVFTPEASFAYALPLAQDTTYALSNFDTSTSKQDGEDSSSAVAIGVVSILLALGSLVVGVLGVMLYRQRERQLQTSNRKEATTPDLQRDTPTQNTMTPNNRIYIWAQRYNPIYIVFSAPFRRPVLLAPFHLRRAATWSTLHSDSESVGRTPTEPHLTVPVNPTYPALALPPPCLLALATTTAI
jgi:hypothetical protein